MADTTLLGQALQHALCALRDSQGLSQQELAMRSGLTRQYISLLERQKRIPRLDTLLALSQGLGLPLATLCGEIERMHDHYSLHRPPAIGEAGYAADEGIPAWNSRQKKLPLKHKNS